MIANLKIKRLHPTARLPVRATDGSACFDLHAHLPDGDHISAVAVASGHSWDFGTGLAVAIPAGWAMLIFSRSGHGFKSDTRLANCVGVIDSDYRGELRVKLTNDRPRGESGGLVVADGDRIAQAMLVQVPIVNMIEVDELPATARGTGGLGSTGR